MLRHWEGTTEDNGQKKERTVISGSLVVSNGASVWAVSFANPSLIPTVLCIALTGGLQ